MRVELKLAREVPVAEDAKAVIVAQSLVSGPLRAVDAGGDGRRRRTE